MTTTDLQDAYAKLREIKIKLSSLQSDFETDSDNDLQKTSDWFQEAVADIQEIMMLISNKL